MNCGWNRWMCMIWSTRTSRQSGFFLKISLRLLTSLTCETRKPHIPMWGCKRREKKTQFALHFQPCSWPFVDCSCILEYAKMWTVLQSMINLAYIIFYNLPHEANLRPTLNRSLNSGTKKGPWLTGKICLL